MKKQLLKITAIAALAGSTTPSFSQTWDSILTGVNKVISATKYPDCNEIVVLSNGDILAATLSGVYKSADKGSSWTKKPIPGPTTSFVGDSYIGIKKVNANRLMALGMGGTLGNSISKSDDGGNSWTASLSGIVGNAIVEELSVAPNGNIFIATRVGVSSPKVYVSTDNGDSWTPKATGFPSNIALWSVLAVDNTTILAGGNNGIYRSTDAGDNWTLVHGTGTGYVVSLKKNSSGVIYAGLASGNIRKSADNGTTWTNTTIGGNNYDIEFDSNNNIYVCTYNTGISKYNSAEVLQATIANSSNGMQNTRLNDLAIDETGATPVLYASCVGNSSVGGAMYRFGIAGVGIEEMHRNMEFSIYPNPANTQLNVSYQRFEGNMSIKIKSLDGSIVSEQVLTSPSVNISELSQGFYFLELKDAQGRTGIQKFIKE